MDDYYMVEESKGKVIWAPNLERVISEVDKNARNEAKVMKGVEEAIEKGYLYEILRSAGVDENVVAEIKEIIGNGVVRIESKNNSLEIYCNDGSVTFTDKNGSILVETFRSNIYYSDNRRPILYNEKYAGSKGEVVYAVLEEIRKIGEKENLNEKDKKNFATALEMLRDTFYRISGGEEFYSVKKDAKNSKGLKFEVIK